MPHLLHTVLRHPDAALQHLRAYGQLAQAELSLLAQAWQRRTLLAAGALLCAGLSVGFLGLLVMAWALVPAPLTGAQWLALSAPAAFTALAGIACLVGWQHSPLPDPMQELARQWALDASWLLPQQPGMQEQDEAP